jgi:integrase
LVINHQVKTNSATCPNCLSEQTWKSGFRKNKNRSIQRHLCRRCGYRFSDPSDLKAVSSNKDNRQVCAMEAKNLTAEQPRKVGSAGATEQAKANIKETIFQYKWWLKKQGYAETTITTRAKLLKTLLKRGANLANPESVKEVIANQTWSPGRKQNAVHAYSSFLKMKNQEWTPPKYRSVRKLPWIPTESEVDQLIAGCSNRIATFLQLLKETGMRPGEAWSLQWIDIDFRNPNVRVTPEKGSNPRIIKLSNKLIVMINALLRKSKYVFKNGLLKSFASNYRQQRRRVAIKLGNSRINQITFRTLRHYKATMEYHKTKDILHVMQLLGHKNIKNTLVYTQLIDVQDDEYISKIAKTAHGASQLIETGFEYVCTTPDDLMIFRKRK